MYTEKKEMSNQNLHTRIHKTKKVARGREFVRRRLCTLNFIVSRKREAATCQITLNDTGEIFEIINVERAMRNPFVATHNLTQRIHTSRQLALFKLTKCAV